MNAATTILMALAIGAGPPPASTASKAAAAQDEDDGYRTAAEERAEASCCATLAREFGRVVPQEDRNKAIREGRCCDLVAGVYDKESSESLEKPTTGIAAPHERSLAQAIFQMVLVLGSICLLAYLVLGKLLPKLLRIEAPSAQKRIMHVIDRLPVDQRRSMVVVRIGGLYFFVGITDHGISLISRLDADDVETAVASAEAPTPKLGKLASALLRRSSQKEN